MSSKKISWTFEKYDKLSFLQKIIPPSILAILTTIFYYSSLKYPFQFDDLANISKKFSIRLNEPISHMIKHSRWISDWLNRFNYQIGLFDPFYYRVSNLIIHISVGILLFYLILDFCQNSEKKSFLNNNSLLISFTTAALFLLHPVQTQAVSYIIQARLEGLATLFILATLFTFVKAFRTKNIFFKFLLFSASLIIALLSFGTKEIVMTIPILLVLVDWFFVSQENWNKFKFRFFFYIISFAIFVLFSIYFLGYEFVSRTLLFKMTTGNNRGNILTSHANDIITSGHFFISSFKVILHYLVIFLWPFNISVEYDWKLSESFFAADSFFPFLILASMIYIAFYTLIKKKNGFIAFGLFWFFINILPRASFIPSPELICDYKTYVASIGWLFIISIVVVYLIKLAIKNLKSIPEIMHNHNSQLALLVILIIPIGFGTLNRNTVWRSSVEFWEDIVKKAPLKARGHNNFGVALSEAGRVDDAISHYKKAIQLDRHYADPLSNIAVGYSLKGEIDQAIAALKGAINIFPNYPEAYNNLGTLLLSKKNYEDAEKSLNFAIDLRPYYGKAFYNLGRLYLEQKDEEKAWQFFKKATEGDLDTAEGFFTLGQMSIRLKKYGEAAKAFEKILQRGVSNPQILFGLANSYFMINQIDKAQYLYSNLVKDHPLDARYLYNLAETLSMKNKTEEALALFKKVTTLPEPLPQAHFKIISCLEKLDHINEAKNYLNELLKIKTAPENFRDIAKKELARLELQEKLDKGNGSIKMSDIKNAMKNFQEESKEEEKNKS